MVYIPPVYPAAIPTITDLPDRVDDADWLYAARYNELKKELRACLTELGVLPKGEFTDVKTRLERGGPNSKCRVGLGSDQDIVKDTTTKVEYGVVTYDPLNEFDEVTYHRFTVSTAGWYQVNALVELDEALDTDDRLYGYIEKNGSFVAIAVFPGGPAQGAGPMVCDIVYCAAFDYIEIFVRHSYTENRLMRGLIYRNWMSIHKLS